MFGAEFQLRALCNVAARQLGAAAVGAPLLDADHPFDMTCLAQNSHFVLLATA